VVTATAHSGARSLRRFYISIGLLGILFAFVGFWPSYFGPVLFEAASKETILNIHAFVFVGWLALFTAQACFAATRRIDLHIRVGRAGIAYGIAVIVVGFLTGYLRSLGHVDVGNLERANSLLYSITLDMAVFAPFFAAAIFCRRQPELHKRLMIVAGTSLLVAAVFRMPFLGSPPNMLAGHAIWFSPVLLTMAYDLWKRGSVHPALIIGLLALIAQSPLFRPAVAGTQAWRSISGWVLGADL
jgi:hypothetical protein